MQPHTDPAHPLRYEMLFGDALRPLLSQLGELIFSVFRDWPYLYASDPTATQSYLASYVDGSSPGAAIVVAFDGDLPVGAATCQRMARSSPSVPSAFAAHGLDPTRFCYLGEAVLLAPYRGRGAGVRFFAEREAHARRLGLDFAAFCAVLRDPADPRRPAGYAPLDAFWRRRGYTRFPGLVCRLEWREIGAAQATPHDLSFWLKSLSGAALPRVPGTREAVQRKGLPSCRSRRPQVGTGQGQDVLIPPRAREDANAGGRRGTSLRSDADVRFGAADIGG